MGKTIFIIAIIILLIILTYTFIKIYLNYKVNCLLEKYEIKCKNISIPGPSLGLILDAKIICNKLPLLDELLGNKNIIIENSGSPKPEDIIFVNLDWTDFKNLKRDSAPKTILCKTKQCYDILKNNFKNKKVIYTGFTSIDRFKTGYSIDYNKWIHICGKSPYKGTIQLVKTWIQHPEFPLLTIKVYDSVYNEIQKIIKNKTVTNLEINNNFITDEEVDILYNTYGVHICPSNQEGWGHYIAEAKSSKAIVLYTDAPCMNETFIDGFDGISIYCDTSSPKMINNGICPFYEINENDIANSVQKVLSLSQEEKQMIGENARNSFLKNDNEFTIRLQNLIYNL